MTLLATGKVDVVSNAGTSNPLQQIASGVDISVFGGHMIEGCMPVMQFFEVLKKRLLKWTID